MSRTFQKSRIPRIIGARRLIAWVILATTASARGDLFLVSADRDNTLYESEIGSLSNGKGEYFFAGLTGEELIRRGVVRFDLGVIPAGSTINSASLELHLSKKNPFSDSTPTISLHTVMADWGEGTSDAPGEEGAGEASTPGDATWIHTFYDDMFWAASGGDFEAAPIAAIVVDDVGFYTWGPTTEMTADVIGWFDDPATNFGWLVQGDEVEAGTARRFDSRENASASVRPVLTVDYTPILTNDCNTNGTFDDQDISGGASQDCNTNGVPDECDLGGLSSIGFDATDAAAGNGPQGIAAGDLDGVNGVDLVVANDIADNISVFLNNGDGTFAAPVNYAVGDGPQAVAIANLDAADGLDLAVANFNSDNVSVLLNAGDGTFGAVTNFTMGDGPRAIAAGDLNGANGPDIVVASEMNNRVVFRLNNGSGSFGTPTNLSVGTMPRGVALANINGSPGLDIISANRGSDNVSLLFNNGNGSFATAVNLTVGDGPQAVATANLDGLTGPDLIVVNNIADSITVLFNAGDGTFPHIATHAAGTGPQFAAVGDFDEVGGLDVAVCNSGSDNVLVYLNSGTGQLAAPVDYIVGDGPRSVTAAELNGAGSLDLASANRLGDNATILTNSGTPVVSDCNGNAAPDECDIADGLSSDSNGNGVPDECESVTGDLDGDGDVDSDDAVIMADVLLGIDTDPSHVDAADLNNDGSADGDDLQPFLNALL